MTSLQYCGLIGLLIVASCTEEPEVQPPSPFPLTTQAPQVDVSGNVVDLQSETLDLKGSASDIEMLLVYSMTQARLRFLNNEEVRIEVLTINDRADSTINSVTFNGLKVVQRLDLDFSHATDGFEVDSLPDSSAIIIRGDFSRVNADIFTKSKLLEELELRNTGKESFSVDLSSNGKLKRADLYGDIYVYSFPSSLESLTFYSSTAVLPFNISGISHRLHQMSVLATQLAGMRWIQDVKSEIYVVLSQRESIRLSEFVDIGDSLVNVNIGSVSEEVVKKLGTRFQDELESGSYESITYQVGQTEYRFNDAE